MNEFNPLSILILLLISIGIVYIMPEGCRYHKTNDPKTIEILRNMEWMMQYD